MRRRQKEERAEEANLHYHHPVVGGGGSGVVVAAGASVFPPRVHSCGAAVWKQYLFVCGGVRGNGSMNGELWKK